MFARQSLGGHIVHRVSSTDFVLLVLYIIAVCVGLSQVQGCEIMCVLG